METDKLDRTAALHHYLFDVGDADEDEQAWLDSGVENDNVAPIICRLAEDFAKARRWQRARSFEAASSIVWKRVAEVDFSRPEGAAIQGALEGVARAIDALASAARQET